jgi:hypothetical protein
MRRLALVAVALAALAAPSTALAGGGGAFVLHGPTGLKAGDTWLAQIRVVGCVGMHYDAPTAVTITQRGTGRTLTFPGRRAGAVGHYTARVVFPAAGEWTYAATVNGWAMEANGPFAVAPAPKQRRLHAALPPVGAALLVLGTGLVLRRRRT